jgi:hypothetical protein
MTGSDDNYHQISAIRDYRQEGLKGGDQTRPIFANCLRLRPGQDFLKSRIVSERVPFPQATDYLGERRSPLARKFSPTRLWSAGRFALRTTLSSANRDREWPQCRYRSVTRILCARW